MVGLRQATLNKKLGKLVYNTIYRLGVHHLLPGWYNSTRVLGGDVLIELRVLLVVLVRLEFGQSNLKRLAAIISNLRVNYLSRLLIAHSACQLIYVR